ncbi:hypothetical protein [Streptomyces sp. NPDC001880]
MTVLAGTISDVDQLSQEITAVLVGSVMGLMLAASVAVTWAKTNSVLSAGVAFVGAAALWFAVMNATVFLDSVGEDLTPSSSTKSAGAGHAVVRVIEPVPGDQR